MGVGGGETRTLWEEGGGAGRPMQMDQPALHSQEEEEGEEGRADAPPFTVSSSSSSPFLGIRANAFSRQLGEKEGGRGRRGPCMRICRNSLSQPYSEKTRDV